MIRRWNGFGLAFCLAALLLAMPAVAAQETSSEPAPEEERAEKPAKKPAQKKNGGFLKGLRAVSGEGGEQQAATRTAGSKAVGEGEEIGDVTPTAEHHRAVQELEKQTVPRADVEKFKEEGGLKP